MEIESIKAQVYGSTSNIVTSIPILASEIHIKSSSPTIRTDEGSYLPAGGIWAHILERLVHFTAQTKTTVQFTK